MQHRKEIKESSEKKVVLVPKTKTASDISKEVATIFKDHQQLLGKLRTEAKKNFRTPNEQLIYYTWKCIDFIGE